MLTDELFRFDLGCYSLSFTWWPILTSSHRYVDSFCWVQLTSSRHKFTFRCCHAVIQKRMQSHPNIDAERAIHICQTYTLTTYVQSALTAQGVWRLPVTIAATTKQVGDVSFLSFKPWCQSFCTDSRSKSEDSRANYA